MLEDQAPATSRRISQQRSLALQRAQRLEIVPHDPGKRQVCGRGEEVADEHSRLTAVSKYDHLVEWDVSRSEPNRDSGQYLRVAIQQAPAVRCGHGLEVVGQIAGSGALIGVT